MSRANLNRHGAWIYAVRNDHRAEHRAFATADAALAWLHEKIVVEDGYDPQEFERWSACVVDNAPGAIDCFGSVYPIVWYDPQRDAGEFEVDDGGAWEESLRHQQGGAL